MTGPTHRPQPCMLLPKEGRDMLIAATQVRDQHNRLVAIDAAIDYVKLRFPHYFHPQPAIKE